MAIRFAKGRFKRGRILAILKIRGFRIKFLKVKLILVKKQKTKIFILIFIAIKD